MSDLVVRAYNVGYGDAVLVSIPERAGSRGTGAGSETTRHLLVDLRTAGSENEDDVLATVVADIADRTGGEVDLFVMSRDHVDTAHGHRISSRHGVALRSRYAWLSGASEPGHDPRVETARSRRLELQRALEEAIRLHQAADDPRLERVIRNNSAVRSPSPVDPPTTEGYHLPTLTPERHTYYVHRSTGLRGKHPFKEARLRVLAPEEDATAYFGHVTGGSLTATAADTSGAAGGVRRSAALETPPAGVDAGAFFDLLVSRRKRARTRLVELDTAHDNTSVVVEVEWRGWRLLFPGDADRESWQRMLDHNALRPVHFVKLPHHGSHGTHEMILDHVLPPVGDDGRERRALVSTGEGGWDDRVGQRNLELCRARGAVRDTREAAPGAPVEIVFPG